MQPKARKLPSLEDLFDLEDDLLGVPDNRTWKAALARGRRLSDGERVLVKYWQKSGQAIDHDLRELWHREMRNAERIRVRPDGEETLVPIMETGETRDAFYLVMSGEWVPLHIKLRNAGAGHWLRNLHARRNRDLLWLNVGRLVRALDVIHGQRIVHGGFGQATIFSASDHEPDFRVGGFEWCLKIGEACPDRARRWRARSPAISVS